MGEKSWTKPAMWPGPLPVEAVPIKVRPQKNLLVFRFRLYNNDKQDLPMTFLIRASGDHQKSPNI